MQQIEFRAPDSGDRFRLDLRTHEAHKGAESISLRPKEWELLLYFCRNAGITTSTSDLHGDVWGTDSNTNDEVVAKTVSDLRRALGDRERNLIRTVQKFGYRFDGELSPATKGVQIPTVLWFPKDDAVTTGAPYQSESIDVAAKGSTRYADKGSGSQVSPEVDEAPTIVVGDRRENPPETPGDLFAAGASSRDITWLPRLRLPKQSIIWNDKVATATSAEEQVPVQVRDRNLLIVGSPFCNLMARAVNETSFFRFDIDPQARKQIELWESSLRGLARHSPELIEFRERLGESYHQLIEPLRGRGFLDPIRQQAQVGVYARPQLDYAAVSLCRHPYSRSKRAIVVAGVHLPGTMAAFERLADPTFFDGRPAGGLLKITIPDGGWYERLLRSRVEWYTPPYSWNALSEGLGRQSDLFLNSFLSELDVEHYHELIESLNGDTVTAALRRMGANGK